MQSRQEVGGWWVPLVAANQTWYWSCRITRSIVTRVSFPLSWRDMSFMAFLDRSERNDDELVLPGSVWQLLWTPHYCKKIQFLVVSRVWYPDELVKSRHWSDAASTPLAETFSMMEIHSLSCVYTWMNGWDPINRSRGCLEDLIPFHLWTLK